MSDEPPDQRATLEALREWLERDELRHSRLIWRLESDSRLRPPWPYQDVWFDQAGAALVDLTGHPTLGGGSLPWFQADADDVEALKLLAGLRLPARCEVLCPCDISEGITPLGECESTGVLDVFACAPGEIGDAALPYEPVRLTLRHRAQVAEAGWRPEDLADEIDETRRGVRWAIVREDKIVARLLVQPISERMAEIADVHTDPAWRRRGYGAALVQNVVRRLHERDITATYSVHPSNLPSKRLAESIGFTYRFSWERLRLDREAG